MRKIGILVILAVFFAGFGFSVIRMETLRTGGSDALLPLAPVDPRALLLGDYMALDYAINRDILGALWKRDGHTADTPLEGRAVIKRAVPGDRPVPPGEGKPFPVAAFVRLDDGTPLARDEMPLAFKLRGRRIITAAPAFYFQEGDAAVYARARYGRIKIDATGRTLLVALCDDMGQDLH